MRLYFGHLSYKSRYENVYRNHYVAKQSIVIEVIIIISNDNDHCCKN
jgi:hypothetical protein